MKNKFYAVMHFLIAWLVRLFMKIRTVNRRREPKRSEGSYLIVGNHIHWSDPICLCAATRYQQPHFMAKKELFNPVLGPMIKAFGAYPVDRGGADVGAIKRTIKMLEDGYSIGMFPQGHRYPGVDPKTTPIKQGVGMIAAKSHATILPVYIKVKDNRVKLFRRRTVIFGEPIKFEELGYNPEAPGEYLRISQLVFDRICQLESQA